MKFEFYERLDDDTIEALWKQYVCMDDWDYILFVPIQPELPFTKDRDDNVVSDSYQIDRLLNGCCQNRWYQVKNFRGKEGIIGVAYHA
jgi:hypothetical protein